MGRCISHAFRRGFTLVELLVVVGIIALLVAILLPVLTKAQETAKAVACGSNLRQVYFAFLQYANENHGIVPPNRQYGAPGWDYYWKILGERGYLGMGRPYAGAANGPHYPMLECPADYPVPMRFSGPTDPV